MKLSRLAGLLLALVLVTGALSVGTASAASSNPLFLPVNGQTITGESGPSTLKAGTGQVITCQKDHVTGTITSSLLVGKVFVHYLECTAVEIAGATTRCTVKSRNTTTEGLILINELHGVLGLILSPAPLDTGIVFLPDSGKVFAELAESKNGTTKCTPETKVTGDVAGLITPVGVDTTKGLLVFPHESIKKIDLTHGIGEVEPEIVAFSVGASLEQHDTLTFSEATGIT